MLSALLDQFFSSVVIDPQNSVASLEEHLVDCCNRWRSSLVQSDIHYLSPYFTLFLDAMTDHCDLVLPSKSLTVRVTMIKSPSKARHTVKQSLLALKLSRLNQSVVHKNISPVRGYILEVSKL